MMRSAKIPTWKQSGSALGLLLCLILLSVLVAPTAGAQTFTVIHSFTGGNDGAYPAAGLITDRAGNLYGTASGGGLGGNGCIVPGGCGTAFRLKPSGTGWLFTPLYQFHGGTNDGGSPEARMVFGPDGRLYGTTVGGGANHDCGNNYDPCGIAFRLTPPTTICKSAICPWNETVIHNFAPVPDASTPIGSMVVDAAGNFYGAASGGAYEFGAIYELTSSGGAWNLNLIYNNFTDGGPMSGVVFDNAGNLYGSDEGEGYGGVFQLTHSGSGWTLNQLYSIIDVITDGFYNPSPPLLDNVGNIYGSTVEEGTGGGGTIFELTAGNWNFQALYYFSGAGGPEESLTMDAAGNLYGTTFEDGAYDKGSVFKLTPTDGGWTYTDLHDFTGGSDGEEPVSNVIVDAQGNLYGTTSHGGGNSCSNGCGVVWEVTP
ncbi:MAG: choice-of-anchor tandem repeat GloVer-containing protein [Candidatus Korobacteraceae bacterium]